MTTKPSALALLRDAEKALTDVIDDMNEERVRIVSTEALAHMGGVGELLSRIRTFLATHE